MSTLQGVWLLTGGASGIGRGTALALAKAGCHKLFLADINREGLWDTARQIRDMEPGCQVKTLEVDISDETSVELMIQGCVDEFGRVDYAVNIAGVVPQRVPIASNDLATYDKVVGINDHGTFLCHEAQFRQMIKQNPLPGNGSTKGSIVSVASLAGINASSGMSTYCASKHAIVGFSKTHAQDYGPHGIRLNVIAPGMIDTDLFRATSPPEAPALLASITPVRRLGQPEDIAALVMFLCSTQASFVHGAVIPCDGGLSLHRGVI